MPLLLRRRLIRWLAGSMPVALNLTTETGAPPVEPAGEAAVIPDGRLIGSTAGAVAD